MTVEQSPLELESSTLEEIVEALSWGRPIALPESTDSFLLAEDARVAFRFYASRRELWASQKQLSGAEVDQLLHALETPQAGAPREHANVSTLKRPRWRIVQVRVHRFAGLHRHCDATGQAPDIVSLELDRDVTCVWGFNGAGKTALQSAIMWCLTGQAHRSQNKPSSVHQPISVELIQPSDEDPSEVASAIALPPIVPLPSAEDLVVLQDKPAVDTWVELTLREHSGREVVVRRELKLGPRGAVTTPVSGIEELGLPQLAIEAGTLMPAIATTMRFDEKTTFADVIAQLTGLRPLQELGKRSDRLAKRLGGEECDRANEDGGTAKLRFSTCKRTLGEAWKVHSEALGDLPDLLSPEQESEENNCQASIARATSHLEDLLQQGQDDINEILGGSARLETQEQVDTLISNLTAAKERLGALAIGALPSVETLKRLGEITDDDSVAVTAKLEELKVRAVEQVARQQKKEETARWQLYAIVSQWHRRNHPDEPISDCPVCGSDLTNVPPDALLDKKVVDALKASALAHTDATKTLLDWQRDTASELLEALPTTLRPFVDAKLRTSLLDIYREAYVTELLRDQAFNTQLRPVKQNAEKVWNHAVEAHPLPALPESQAVELPQELRSSSLGTRFANLQAALLLARHRQLSEDKIRLITQRYFGSGPFVRDKESDDQRDMSLSPLRQQVLALQQAVTSADPIIALLRQMNEIEVIRQSWQKARNRHRLLRRAAAAIREFLRLPGLVHHQVEGLLTVLDERTTAWLKVIYRPHYVGGPAYLGLDPMRTQGVGLYAGLGSVRVHAHEVMNSSHLRACVWAFVFSLWERIRDRAGALDVLQLDDPQTYFDPINIENLAAAIPKLVEAGMAPIITSNDNRFIAAVKSRLPRNSLDSPSWTMLQISPISSSRQTAAFTPAVEEVMERRAAWLQDESDTAKAQEFVERVRLHIENRLWDLLASDPMLMYKPTLADLIAHISSARNGGEQPFNEVPFERLLNCKSLRPGSAFYSIINNAHHNLRDVTPFNASEVSDAFDEVDRLLRSCSASYARFMGRLTREDEDLFFAAPPPAPPAIALKDRPIRVLGDFSARTYTDAIAVEADYTTMSLADLGEVALYALRAPSLGALALPGQTVAVSLTEEARNGDPVIALHGNKVLARRYHSDPKDTSRLTLACDQSGAERVAPAITLVRNKVRILPIVGVFYGSATRNGDQEARCIDSCSVLDKQFLGARIIDDSGYPVVRNGDLVLLEPVQMSAECSLDLMKGDVVALVAAQHGEQFAYLKRVGSSIQGTGLRIFENVGTFGDSLAVSCSEGSDNAIGCLQLQSMWRVHGVIRRRLLR